MFQEIIKIMKRLLPQDLKNFVRSLERYLLGFDKKIKQSYFNQNSLKKLYIGCNDHILGGWLNSDCFPQSASVLHLDATKHFPFEENTFDFVFSEHMIEHVSYSQGLQMLSKCYRVLKKGGKTRISTPDLSSLIALYGADKSVLQEQYIKWSIDIYNIKNAIPSCFSVFVINNFFRNWGHQFIYNTELLRASLERVGFSKIVKCELNRSEDKELRNLENDKRMPEGFLQLETVTLEGTK